MKEIKFRAWLKKEKKMVDVDYIEFDREVIGYANPSTTAKTNENGVEAVYGFYYFEGIELMQSTGLHDDNGKEIYEGDIVRIYVNNGQILKIQVEMPRVYDEMREGLTGFKYEVIGNKYENADLL